MSEYVQTLELQIKDNAVEASKGLDKLAATLRDIRAVIDKSMNLGPAAKQVANFANELTGMVDDDNVKKLSKLALAISRVVTATKGMEAISKAKQNVESMAGLSANTASSRPDSLENVRGTTETIVDNLREVGNAENAVREDVENVASSVETSNEVIRQHGEALSSGARAEREAEAAAKAHADATRRLGEALKSTVSGFMNLSRSFTHLARNRLFRYVIREVVGAFSTGLQNVREYSKAINGLYAKDMQGLDNTLLKMKNSLGAALVPMVQSLIPVFQQLANVVIDVSNIINQFFALLRGQSTWTRATNVEADALENVDKKAAGAGRSMKNLLAAWDELNIIQSQGGGSGAGTSLKDQIDYTNMFEEVDVFDDKIRSIVTFVKNNLEQIEPLVATILAHIAGLSVGAATFTVSIIYSYKRGEQAGIEGKTLAESIIEDLPSLLTSGLAGALIGAKVGLAMGTPVSGAVVGLIATIGISLLANIIGWNNGLAIAKRQRIRELANNMQSDFGGMYPVDINVKANVLKARVADMEDAKGKVQDAANELSDTYTLWVAAGMKNDQNSIEGLKNSVKGVIDAVNEKNETEKNFIMLTFGTVMADGTYSMTELGQSLLKGVELEDTIISNIGTEIGRILGDSTATEYRKTVLPKLFDVLRQMVDETYRAQVLAKYDIELSKSANGLFYEDGNGNLATDDERVAAYMVAHEEAVRPVREAAAAVVNEMIENTGVRVARLKVYRNNADSLSDVELKEVTEYLASTGQTLDDAIAELEASYNKMLLTRQTLIDDEVAEILGDDQRYKVNIRKAVETLLGNNPPTKNNDEALDIINSYYSRYGQSSGKDKWGYVLDDPGQMQNWLYYYLAERTGVDIDYMWAHLNAGGSPMDLLDTESIIDIYKTFESFGHGNELLDMMDKYTFGTGFRDVVEGFYKEVLDFFVNPSENAPETYTPPENTVAPTVEIDEEELRRLTELMGGHYSGSANYGYAFGRAATIGTNIETNYGIVNAGGTPSVETEQDSDDAQTEETNRNLRSMVNLMQQFVNKEFVAKAVPSAAWGAFNRRSEQMAEKVYG